MNAPDKNAPAQADTVVDWLTNGTRDERFIDDIFAQMCIRLQQAGIPLRRATLHVQINHPQWLGARMIWSDGMRGAEIARVDYDVRERSEYIGSPPTRFMTVPPRCGRGLNRNRLSAASMLSTKRCGRWA